MEINVAVPSYSFNQFNQLSDTQLLTFLSTLYLSSFFFTSILPKHISPNMKSPAWLLLPSIIILVFSYLLIVPGLGNIVLPSLHVHKINLSPTAQEYVTAQTGTTAPPSYVVHLFNYCEYVYKDSSNTSTELIYKCHNTPSISFYFNFEQVLGLPDTIENANSTTRNEELTVLKAKVLKFKLISLLYTYLTLMMILSRFSVISLVIPLRLVHLRLRSRSKSSLHNKFFMLRGLFTFSYVLTFVTANLLSAVAILHLRFHFYRGVYDLGNNSGIETTLSTTTIVFNSLVLLLSFIELYPAITYMCLQPPPQKQYSLEDPESRPDCLYTTNTNLSSTSTIVVSDLDEKDKIITSSTSTLAPVHTRASILSASTRVASEELYSLNSLTPSSLVSEPPSLQATSNLDSEASSSIVSEVSTTDQYGLCTTPSISLSIRSSSTSAGR